MNTFNTVDIASHVQEARVRDALHRRAVKIYRRDHRAERHPRGRVAAALRRLAARLDGQGTQSAARAPRGATVTRLSPR